MVYKKKLIGLASFRIINSFRNGIFISFMGIYLRENLLLSVTESNLFFTLLELIGALAQFLVWGWIIDKYKKRNSVIILGESIPAVGYLGIYFLFKYLLQTSGTHIAGLWIVFGISSLEFFWGAGFVGFYSLLSDVPGASNRAKYLGYTISLTSAGHILGSWVGGVLFDYNGPGTGFSDGILFFLLTPIIFGFVLLSWFTRKDTEQRTRTQDYTQTGSVEVQTINKNPNIVSKDPEGTKKDLKLFYWLLIGVILSGMGRGGIKQVTFFFLRLPESIAISSFAVSLLVTSRWLAFLISGPIASKFTGRSVKYGYLATISWFAVLPLLFPLVRSFPIALLLYASNGLCMGISSVTAFSIISKIIPEKRRGRLLSQYNAARMVAVGSGGSLIGGPIADLRLSQGASLGEAYTFVFTFVFVLGLLAVIVTLWKGRPAFHNLNTTP